MKSAILGIFVNLGLALIKCTAGLLGRSFALVADGLESITDVFSGLIVYFGLKIAVKPPDADHPYGHGKAEPVAAVVASLALVAAALIISYEGIREITAPHGAPAPFTLVVLAGVLIIKELLFRHVASVGDSIGSTAVKSDAWHHKSRCPHIRVCFRGDFNRAARRTGVGSGRWLGSRWRCARDSLQCLEATACCDS
jgi:cation diffusion facilitator family transporter